MMTIATTIATIATVEAATITLVFYPEACERKQRNLMRRAVLDRPQH